MAKVFLILNILFFLVTNSVFCEILDRIVATVNQEVITLSELENRARPLMKKYEAEMGPDFNKQEFYARILPQLIDEKLIQEETKKRGIVVSDEEVDRAIDRICSENLVTMAEFKEKLASEGLTFDDYRRDLKIQMERSYLINAEVRSKVVITDHQIDAFLMENSPAETSNETLYSLEHMSVNFKSPHDDKLKKETKNMAEKALKLVHEGKTFAEVATTHNDIHINKGDFALKELSESIRQAVLKLKPGEVSGLIETPDGLQAIKLLAIKKGGREMHVESDIREKIRQKLYMEQLNARFDEWLGNLRSKSTIKILF